LVFSRQLEMTGEKLKDCQEEESPPWVGVGTRPSNRLVEENYVNKYKENWKTL